MNTSRTFTSLLLCLAYFILPAQDITQSPALDFSSRNQQVEVLGQHNDLIYAHLHDSKDHELLAFYSSLRLKWRKPIPFYHRQYDFKKLFFHKGQGVFLYSERVNQKKRLMGKLVDAEGKVDTAFVTMIDSMEKGIGETFSEFAFRQSQNKKYIVSYWLDENMFDDNYLHYTVFSKSLNVKERGKVKIPFVGKRSGFHSLVLNNDGKVFAIIAEYVSQNKEYAKLFWILSSGNRFQDYHHMELKPEEEIYLNNVRFTTDNLNETITVVGFYSEGNGRPTGAEGMFFSRIPFSASKPLTTRYEPFSAAFIAKIKGTKKSRKNSKLYSFIIDKVILRQDGGALVVAESYYKTYRSTSHLYDIYGFPNYHESTVIYHFDELLVFSMHPSGRVHWKNIVVKNQSSAGDYGRHSSYQLMNSGMFLKFVFNEKISNRTNVIEYTMDVNGDMKREVLLNSKNYGMYLMPQFGKQLSAYKIVLPSLDRGELKMIQLDYKVE